MQVGALGGVAFLVSPEKIKTARSISYKGSSTYAVHKRLLGKGLLEYTGSDPETISFSIRVSKVLGEAPDSSIATLRGYVNNGTIVPFVLGNKTYGSYRWIVKSFEVKGEEYDKKGNLIGSDISVSITEYAKG
ncbi:MAG: phage tail protein [Ruminiclostridium sp.]|nr:phage tail protein [Ruminiclostridium sp.]